ncbi:Leucine-rich repeat domain, L domain-like [Phytophthora cactorum]|nr:Leucine-rich repeat domain, L domain-like [Phytophthora cactorum]
MEVLLNATKLSVGKKEHLSHYLKRITHLALNGDASKALMQGGSDTEAIRKIQNLHHCPNLKVLYLYDNEVGAIENLDAVPQLTHLHLQGNCLRRIENLEPLRLLEKLYLEKNSIVRLEGLTGCSRLQELYLANQNVPIDTYFSFEEDTMRTLAVSVRLLTFCALFCSTHAGLSANIGFIQLSRGLTKPLTLLRCLEQLDLSKNLISDLEEIFALVGGVTSLIELDLRGNEVTATAKICLLAALILTALLDKKDVDPNQRRMMQSHLAHKYRKRLGPSSRRQIRLRAKEDGGI